jgi:hypothetical protein
MGGDHKVKANDFKSDELFYEPPKLYPEQDFEIDGIKVHFEYITDTLPHFDFYGDISETGYRSCFPYPEHLDLLGVEGTAKANIQNLKAIYKLEQEKLKRKKKK